MHVKVWSRVEKVVQLDASLSSPVDISSDKVSSYHYRKHQKKQLYWESNPKFDFQSHCFVSFMLCNFLKVKKTRKREMLKPDDILPLPGDVGGGQDHGSRYVFITYIIHYKLPLMIKFFIEKKNLFLFLFLWRVVFKDRNRVNHQTNLKVMIKLSSMRMTHQMNCNALLKNQWV